MDSLPRELIPKITIYLTPINIDNLILSHSKFTNVFNFDWREYFQYHLALDINFDKTTVIAYSKKFVGKLNQLQSRPFDFSLLSFDYLFSNRSSLIIKITNKLLMLKYKIIDKYQDNPLYHKLIKIDRPVFMNTQDFNKYGIFRLADVHHVFIKVAIERLLKDYLDKILIIKNKFLCYHYKKYFFDCVDDFLCSYPDRILVITT